MPNKNYLKERRKEYRVAKDLRMLGWDVLRTAGSHGFCDLIALKHEIKRIRFIQCKPDNFSKLKIARLNQKYKYLNNMWDINFEVF